VRTPAGHEIDETSVIFRVSRASGPGGQHVNVTESRVEVVCDLDQAGLPLDVYERVHARLGRFVRSVSQQHRSQMRNRAAALAGLLRRIDEAARVDPPRHPTRPSMAARTRRLDAKRRRSSIKKDRRRPDDD
jgi:ribosome-associated protein